jgi:hypothetical protein
MSASIFEEGGEFGTKRVRPDQFELHIPIPTDEDGLVGRECPDRFVRLVNLKLNPTLALLKGKPLLIALIAV